jgi:hypothetical protein
MNITGFCTYETPCGWCTKWDKKCDKKIPIEHNNGLTWTPRYDNGKTYGFTKENTND